jgi:hypothetical protein
MGIELRNMPSDIVEALDCWIEQQGGRKPTREEAVQLALIDWLVTRGLLPSPCETARSMEEHADLTSEPDA